MLFDGGGWSRDSYSGAVTIVAPSERGRMVVGSEYAIIFLGEKIWGMRNTHYDTRRRVRGNNNDDNEKAAHEKVWAVFGWSLAAKI